MMRCCSLSSLLLGIFVAFLLIEESLGEWRPMGRFGKRAANDPQEADWTPQKETRAWRPQGRFGRRKKADSVDSTDFIIQKEIRGWRPQGRFGKRTETEVESGSSSDWPVPATHEQSAEVTSEGGERIQPAFHHRAMEDVNLPIIHDKEILCIHLSKSGLYKCVRWQTLRGQREDI